MFFDEKFIEKVENDPISGIASICSKVLSFLDKFSNNDSWSDEEHEILWESATFIDLIIKTYHLQIRVAVPAPISDMGSNCMSLKNYIECVNDTVKEKALLIKISSYKQSYENALKSTFAYEFSQGDLERVQYLIDELRKQISGLENLEQDHRQRLLRRLEKLQSELHKRVSDLDRFWGLIGDAGVVLGKLGTDAKPVVDRIREIAEIAWNTQSRTEELPSHTPNPMLEQNQ